MKIADPEPPDQPQIAHLMWVADISCEMPKHNTLIREIPPPPWWWTAWFHVRRLALRLAGRP